MFHGATTPQEERLIAPPPSGTETESRVVAVKDVCRRKHCRANTPHEGGEHGREWQQRNDIRRVYQVLISQPDRS